ncbi:hypothetical protein SynPROSU1_02007 [Synechococcus sp. PROS-U-1]|nr:hypothetical protein SynPROSU1_02007 [Synechococcus sp. PROS-U-1]
MATPSIWMKSRVVSSSDTVASSVPVSHHDGVDTREPPP